MTIRQFDGLQRSQLSWRASCRCGGVIEQAQAVRL
jgi:hypothetical protein